MFKDIKKWGLSLIAIVVISLGAIRQSHATTANLTFTGVNGVSQGGIYVGKYFATIDGKPNQAIFCDDFYHHVGWGENWDATVNTFGDLSTVRFQQGTPATTLQAYGAVAWLIEQMVSHPAQVGDIQFAEWAVFNPSVTGQGGFTPASQTWLNTALGKTYTAAQFSFFKIYTPIDRGEGSSQEMFSATPEPGSMILLGAGLVIGAIIMRRREDQEIA